MAFTQTFLFFCSLLCFAVGVTESFNYDVCSSQQGGQLEVTYVGGGDRTVRVQCGTAYPLSAVSSAPAIKFAGADKSKIYEVLMLDPDAPSNKSPKCMAWLHLVMSNVKGSDLASGVSVNDERYQSTEHNPPTPPKGSGYHRYIFVVFSHKEKLSLTPVKDRCGFDVDLFISDNKLSSTPDAANMFKTKHPNNDL